MYVIYSIKLTWTTLSYVATSEWIEQQIFFSLQQLPWIHQTLHFPFYLKKKKKKSYDIHAIERERHSHAYINIYRKLQPLTKPAFFFNRRAQSLTHLRSRYQISLFVRFADPRFGFGFGSLLRRS
ncbi:hypothetical protein ACOSQ3_015013 [Xanthoceras sorbifolium]